MTASRPSGLQLFVAWSAYRARAVGANQRAWNPDEWARRIVALKARGLDAQLSEDLWVNGDDSLVSQLEAIGDAQIAELNAAYADHPDYRKRWKP